MKTPSCCESHPQVECGQGDFCPLRNAGPAAEELLDDTGLLICQGIALLTFIVSVVVYASL